MERKNTLNVRRLVGAILLTLFAIGDLGYCFSLMEVAWVGIVRQFQLFLYFFGAWSIGLAIWYFVTLTKPTNKIAELIIKIIFFVVMISNAFYAAIINDTNATVLAIVLMICYAIGCPWGPKGYSNHPYSVYLQKNNTSKPWYKNWWFYVTLVASVLVAIFLGFVLDGDLNKNTTHLNNNYSTHTSGEKGNKITVQYQKYRISALKNYRVNYVDNSWPGGTIRISRIKVYKTAKPYRYDSVDDGKFRIMGFVRIYMTVHAKQDVSVYATQGTYSYSDGEQYEDDAPEDWDGDINKGVIKSGTITLPVKKLPTTSSLKSVRMKFDVASQDDKDDSLDKTFDFDVDLK